MNIWCIPRQHPLVAKCEICGREIEQPIRSGRFRRICLSCLARAGEKKAA